MLLRKLNSALSLLITLLLMDHAIFMGVYMLSRGGIEQNASKLPRLMFMLMMVHAIISIILAIRGHKGTEKRKYNGYAQMNAPTYFQRVSGILLIVFTVLHVLGASGVMQPPQMVHVIVPPLFFTLSLAHVAVSASKALITLGIGNAKFVKVADVAMKLICCATLIADLIGFYLDRV